MNCVRISAFAILVCASTATATVTYVGDDNATDSKWRTPSVAKPNDLDADNVYGTAGYYLPRGLALGYNDPWMAAGETNVAGAWNTQDINAMPAWFQGLVVTNADVRLRSWGGDGGNFGNLDNVGSGHQGVTGAPMLLNGAANFVGASMGLLLKRSASPAFRLTLIVGNSTEEAVWQVGQTVTLDDGSGAVSHEMATPTFTATGKTTYQSWDVSAGSSDVFIELSDPGAATRVRLAGLAVDTSSAAPPTAPIIAPLSSTNLVGANFSLSAKASGTAPTYRWFKESGPGTPITTGSVLNFPSLALADAGSYYFTASNAAGSITSALAKVTVNASLPASLTAYQAAVAAEPSLISYYKFDLQNVQDSKGTNHGTAVGGVSYSPAFFGGGSKAVGINSGQVDLGNVAAFEFADGSGTVEMWFRCGWTGPTPASADAYLFACQDPVNSLNYSIAVNSGRTQIILRETAGNVLFSGLTLGNGWHHLGVVFDAGNVTLVLDGSVLEPQPFTLSGSPASTQIGSSNPTDGGNNRWIGEIDEVAIYANAISTNTIIAHRNLDPTPPTITGQPGSKGAFLGDPFVLQASATGPQIRYQWYHNNSAVIGATNLLYQVSSAVLGDAGSYFLTVSNQNLVVTSAVATVTVWTPKVPAYEATVRAESGLISLYTFDTDNNTSFVVNDVKGTNQGTVIGGQAYAPGLGGGTNLAFNFDGSSIVSLGSVLDFAFTNGIGTVELLMRNDRPVNSGINACMASYRQDPAARYSFFAMSPLSSYADWNGIGLAQASTGPIAPESWHHIVWAFTTNPVPTLNVYFDGVNVGSFANYGLGTGDPTLATAQLGAGNGTGGEYWLGALDNVAFYSKTLSPAAVVQHFGDLTGTVLTPPTLTITKSGSDVIISWTGATSGWVLEKADAIAGAAWGTVGTASPVTIPISGNQGFLRLRKL